MREKILKLIKKKEDLPPLPEIIIRIDEMLRSPDYGISEIAHLIETDAALAGRVLQIANSVYYGAGRREISTLSGAVVRLGILEVRRLVYSISISKLFVDSPFIDRHNFWQHSLAVALYTQKLAHFIDDPTEEQSDTAYLCGLMHDVGIMVFCNVIRDDYHDFIDSASKIQSSLHAQEKEAFGIDHAELGAEFMKEWWPISEDVVEAVRWHHFPFQGDPAQQRISQLVHVANGIITNQGIKNGVDVYCDVFEEGAWSQLGLSFDDINAILREVKESLYRAERMLKN